MVTTSIFIGYANRRAVRRSAATAHRRTREESPIALEIEHERVQGERDGTGHESHAGQPIEVREGIPEWRVPVAVRSDGGGPSGGAGYQFSKQVVAHYVNDLALTLAPKGIRVNALHPTNVNTDMLQSPPMYRAFRPDLPEPTRADAELAFPVMNAMPIPYIEPEDVSELVLFLASDASRYLTGQQIKIDAGGFLKKVPWSGT
jgi:hypothetical protein